MERVLEVWINAGHAQVIWLKVRKVTAKVTSGTTARTVCHAYMGLPDAIGVSISQHTELLLALIVL